MKNREPKTNPSELYIKMRERKRWQMGFRRYVIEKTPNEKYAPYFGIDSNSLRKWFELQFYDDINWLSFGTSWQFDHIIPVVYFDFDVEDELKLCWNFINLRVEPIHLNRNRGHRIDVLAVKYYFEDLFAKTGFSICNKMLEKINSIEVSNIETNDAVINFMIENKQHLENISSLNNFEFNRFNQGMSLNDILLERQILQKFSS